MSRTPTWVDTHIQPVPGKTEDGYDIPVVAAADAEILENELNGAKDLIRVLAMVCVLMTGLALYILSTKACKADDSAVYVTGPTVSRHPWHNREHYNERNDGLGILYKLKLGGDRVDVSAGVYRNSERERSYYALVNWALADWAIRPGIAAGVVTGYKRFNDGGPMPVAMATLTANVGPTIIRVSIVPNPAAMRDTAIALTVGIGLW